LFQNILIMNSVRLDAYLFMMMAITLIDIGLSLTTFRNISEEIEYMMLITRVFYLFSMCGRVIEFVITVPSQMRLVQVAIWFILERLSALKMVFCYKYNQLFATWENIVD
jgi:hypothetical protein